MMKKFCNICTSQCWKVLLGLEFYQVYLLFFFVDMLHATSGGFGTQWFPFLLMSRLFVCLDFDPCPLFLFLSLLRAFFITKVGMVSSSINNVFKVKCQSTVV